MSDYFSEVKTELVSAANRRAHVPWWARVRLPVRHRGLAIVVAALVVATPAIAAVGTVSGWFSAGKPDGYYPASPTSGLGTVLPNGDRLLPIRVADPDGGPPWGIRLVRTSRDDTCIQVGRVEDGQIGALGIDGAWGDDHEFHEIKPNDGMADICGATDGAGHGFANQAAHGAPASVDVPLYNSGGGSPDRCRSPYIPPRPALLGSGRKLSAALKKMLTQVQKQRADSPVCPASSMRMIFAGLLGPDAKSITYRTPSGQTETEQTSGGVGAYLIVFRETKSNCADFTETLIGGSTGCQSGGTGGESADLFGPTAVTKITYKAGKTCGTQPSPSFASAYKKFVAESRKHRSETAIQSRARFARFLAAHHLTTRTWLQAVMPHCAPVGWVAAQQNQVTAADITTPLKVSISEGRRFCSKGPWPALSVQDNTVTCDHRIPHGYTSYWESSLGPNGPLFALIRVSFTAREPVTTSNSFYEWHIKEPGNNGGGSNRTQANVRRGETVTFTMSEAIPGAGPGRGEAIRGIYHGTITYTPNVGQAGPQNGGDYPGENGSLTVGTFSFKLPPKE